MVFTTLKRITRTGFVNFWRNGFLSFAAIVVITLSLCSFGAIIFTSAFGRTLLADVKDKVDINVYFTLSAPESDILALQSDLNSLPEVASTTYVSRDDALAAFTARWQDNALIMQGLQEVGDNPFPASINIKAKDPGRYGDIAAYLTNKNPTDASGTPIIEKVNYQENKLIIDRLSRIIPTVEQAGTVIALLLVIVAVIVVWNTIRLIIFTAKDEIAVMKLVGASNIYVRGPLVVSGIMYGLVSAAITLVLMAAFAYWSDTLLLRLAGVQVAADFGLLVNVLSDYFRANFAEIFVIIVGAGVVLGGVSSYIAARRYLKV
ncbi:MAG: permease-like cell division protein FtsX [Patescibacteria group bacterium]|nr:permease-like cell division protein FtsX [Patescibacteria group bacterium]MDE1940703.1 permease-like cell division protein FtsX [Patescibacteria group bacterium]MDE1966954.1 permease-like cell division protein FtsX [Patescibacteria group bacterium]